MTPELKTSCEVVFQEHKLSSTPISWNKDAFRGRMSIGLCEMAKETLLQKKVIFFPKPTKRTITTLNPVVATAHTFEEAIAMIENKVPNFTASVTEEQPVYSGSSYSGSFSYADTRTDELAKSNGHDEIPAKEKWWLKPLFFYVVWPVSSAVLSVLIAYFMSELVEMSYRK